MSTSRPLHLTWLVARREIRLRGKTQVFVITTAILLIAVALPAALSGKGSPDRIGVVGGDKTTASIVAEAAKVSGGRAVAVPQPSRPPHRRRCATAS